MISQAEWAQLTTKQQTTLANLLRYLPNDDIQIRKAKSLLVDGYAPEAVAKATGVPLKQVEKYFSESWNPQSRTKTKPPQRLVYRMLWEAWQAGDELKSMCERWNYPLYTIIRMLKSKLSPDELNSRMPDQTDPLYIEYIKTCNEHAAKKKRLEKRAEKTQQAKAEKQRKRAEREERAKQNRERKQAERDRIDAQRQEKIKKDFH